MRRALLAGLVLALVAPAAASAATLEPVGTFVSPIYVTSLPGDPDRLLVVEKRGTIQLVDHGVASTFLDLAAPGLVSTSGERGLLSVAPAPDYARTHRLYVFYTRAPDGALEVDEFTAEEGSVSLSTRRPLLAIPHPEQTNHNGGQLQFGPDGLLYVSTGDGGGAGDLPGNAQNTDSLLGKILRIDPRPSAGAPYTIPPTNPFAGAISPRPEIWAYGLRNPWRFSFDRLTGELLIADVGQGSREEIDLLAPPEPGRGANLGWNCREGSIAFPSAPTSCAGASSYIDPIYDYSHDGGGCAIVGGYVVRDPSLGDLYGRYVFSDNCDGTIRSLVPVRPAAAGVRAEGLRLDGPTSFGEDSCGRLYVADLTGAVSRFAGSGQPSCAAGAGAGADAPRCGGRRATRVAATDGSVSGSRGVDVIVADARRNRIRSGAGDDLICALGGRDFIRAGRGDDRIRAGGGRDACFGGRGKDRTRSC